MTDDTAWLKTFGWICCGIAAIAVLMGVMALMIWEALR
jgi:hypothetical protein